MIEVGRHAVFGSCFDVVADEPLASELIGSLRDLRVAREVPVGEVHRLSVRRRDDNWTVSWDDNARYSGPVSDLALYDLLIAVNVHAASVASAAGHAVLHGGAITVDGRAVALVGHSGTGKSTLTTAMARYGHPYLADEVVAVDDDLVVQPFHRPVGLRRGGADAIGVRLPEGPYGQIHPYRVGLCDTLGTPTPLAVILLLKRDADHGVTPRIDAISPARALFELANQTLGATDLEREMFGRLGRLVRRVPVCELHYSEPSDAITSVERFASGGSSLDRTHENLAR